MHLEVRVLNPILDAHTNLEVTFGTNTFIGTLIGIRNGPRQRSVPLPRFAKMLERLVTELSYSTNRTTELAAVILRNSIRMLSKMFVKTLGFQWTYQWLLWNGQSCGSIGKANGTKSSRKRLTGRLSLMLISINSKTQSKKKSLHGIFSNGLSLAILLNKFLLSSVNTHFRLVKISQQRTYSHGHNIFKIMCTARVESVALTGSGIVMLENFGA